MSILKVVDFNVSIDILGKNFNTTNINIIKNINLTLNKNEILTIVGSSGSGKSIFSSALFDLLSPNAQVTGDIYYKGEKVSNLINRAIYIPQTSSYLDPLMKVEQQIKLSLNVLAEKTKGLYPFQCSGGMIRSAFFDLVHDNDSADIIIADEPTPGMDVSSALKALASLRKIADNGKSVILITHDIDLAIKISDKVAVFYDGAVIEIANACDFLNGTLRHHYTKALYNALPQNGFHPIDLPKLSNLERCFFSEKCDSYNEKCNGNIKLKEVLGGYVRCSNAPLW